MKNKKTIFHNLAALLLASGLIGISCNKVFDEPPGFVDPNLTATTTVSALTALLPGADGSVLITTDGIIKAQVVANDQSGNFYKQIIVQDETAGIAINIDGYSLYTSYPVGRFVYIQTQGLLLAKESGVWGLYSKPAVGGGYAPILNIDKDKFVIKGALADAPAAKVVTPGGLNPSLINTLIQLDNMEFLSTDTASTYSDFQLKSNINFVLNDCSSGKITLRTSGYANFAALSVPNGNGSITGIYSVYKTTFSTTNQLYIRDTTDVQMNGARCTGSGGGGGAVKYKGGTFSSNNFAKISAYKSGVSTVKTWLVTPVINLTGVSSPVLTFNTVDGYDDGATLTAYISTNYAGSATPWTSTWTPLAATISSGHSSGYAPSFTGSGNLSLSAYAGNVYVAFVYEGSDPSNTTTFEVDDVKVAGGAGNVFSEDFTSVVKDVEISLAGWVNAAE